MQQEYTNLIIGGIAATVSRTATAPLEVLKIQQQNNYLKYSLRSVWHQEGIRGFWKGNGVNCIRLFPQYAINYATYKFCQSNLLINDVKSLNFISAMTAGLVSIVSIYPLETVRTRLSLQMNHSQYNGLVDAMRKIPLSNLYQGLRMTVFGYVPFNAFHFSFYEIYKRKFDTSYQFLPGACAGVSAISITYPTDLVRKRLMISGINTEVKTYTGIIDCVKKIVKTEGGIPGLYRGLFTSYIKIIPTSGITFTVIDYLKKYS